MTWIRISLGAQTLTLHDGDHIVSVYSVSTAAKGAGEQEGSEQTPCGRHVVAEAIGSDRPLGAVFIGRQFTGDIWGPSRDVEEPDRDWVLSRILRLAGLEPGRNSGGRVDTFARCIYIHGASDRAPMGVPLSHGCIRMRNADVIDLFDRVRAGTLVVID